MSNSDLPCLGIGARIVAAINAKAQLLTVLVCLHCLVIGATKNTLDSVVCTCLAAYTRVWLL
jgi:hypothetical protein